MATKIGSLFGDVSLRTAQLDKDIKSIGKKLGKMGKSMQSTGKDLTRKLTAPLVGIGVAALVSFGSFEKGMKEVRSLMPDLNQGEFVELQQDVRDLSVELGVNAVDSVGALYQAISAGVPKGNAIEFLQTATQSGIAGLTTTTTAVDTLTTALNAYKRPAEDAESVADALFTTVRLGKTNFEEIGASLSNVAPLAAAMNVPLEEVMAGVATLTKAGTPTAQAMNQIRASLVALQKPTDGMRTAISNLGFDTGQQLLDAKGYLGALEALRTESGLSATALTEAFGRIEGYLGLLGQTGQNFDGAVEDLRAMTDASGAMTKAFETNNEGLLRSWQASLAIIREVGFQIAEQLAPHVIGVAEAFKEWYASNEGSVPGWTALGVKIGAIAAVLGPLLIVMGQLVIILSSAVTWVLSLGVVLGVLLHRMGFLREAGEQLGVVIVKVFEGDWVGAVKAAIAMMWEIQKTFNPLAMAADFLWGKWRPFWDFFVKQASLGLDRLRSLWAMAKKIASLPGQLGESIGGFIGDVAFRADGGPVSGGSPYIVGEQGPELFVPRYSGAIVPNHALGGGGQTINMTFNGVGMEIQGFIKNNRGALGRIAVQAVNENNLRTV